MPPIRKVKSWSPSFPRGLKVRCLSVSDTSGCHNSFREPKAQYPPLEVVIQRGSPRPSSSSFAIHGSQCNQNCDNRIYAGGLGTNFFVKQANALLCEQTKRSKKKIEGIKANMKSHSDDTISIGSKIAIPLILKCHFFVVVECCGNTVGFYKSVQCYDSNMSCTRITRRTLARSELAIFLQDFHHFILNFIVCDRFRELVEHESDLSPPPKARRDVLSLSQSKQ